MADLHRPSIHEHPKPTFTLTTDTDPVDDEYETYEGSMPAYKRFVDARITIVEDGVNRVGEPHTFTVAVEKDYGDGAGFVPAYGVTPILGMFSQKALPPGHWDVLYGANYVDVRYTAVPEPGTWCRAASGVPILAGSQCRLRRRAS